MQHLKQQQQQQQEAFEAAFATDARWVTRRQASTMRCIT
jgi:hypothetical protein